MKIKVIHEIEDTLPRTKFSISDRNSKLYRNVKIFAVISIVVLLFQAVCVDSFQIDNEDDSKNSTDHYHEKTSLLSDEAVSFSLLAPSSTIECKSDFHCADSKVCINGSCIRTCRNGERLPNCIYFHCASKMLITNNNNNNESWFNLIETNNHPYLTSYLMNQKCSWLLQRKSSFRKNSNFTEEAPTFIELTFNRFSTLQASDYLYIFAGDSIYSPLIASLRYYFVF